MIEFSINENKLITKTELLELSEVHNAHCISVFIPTHRGGVESLEGKDALHLKNQLKEIKSKLEREGMDTRDIEKFVKPVEDLLKDSEFWREQSDGLAVFLSEDIFRVYTVPISFEPYHYLSNEFYLKPIIPLLNGDGFYYILTLKKDEVKFYEGTRFSITEIIVDDLIPSRLEDRVGHDHKQKNLQFRTQQGNKGAGSYHGQQDLDSTEKKELEQFFSAVDKGLMYILNKDQNPPLVVCCLDFYFSIYQKINSYQNLYPEHISGNPSDSDVFVLHERVWELLEPSFSKTRQDKINTFNEFYGTGRASVHIEDIFPAAFEGRIDTLFLEKRTDIFGIYNPTTNEIRTEETQQSPNVSLTNLLSMMVLKTGGTVYLQEKENMPAKTSKVNALFRY